MNRNKKILKEMLSQTYHGRQARLKDDSAGELQTYENK